MSNKLRNNDKIFDIVSIVILFILLILVLYPLYFVVIASISDPDMITNGEILLIPKGLNVEGYKYIFRDKRIWSGYYNTIKYTLFGTLFAIFLTIPSAYALSRKDLIGKNIIMKLMVFTMYFNGGLIPTYLVVNRLHLVNTPYVLIIMGSFSVFNFIIARTFFVNTVSQELQEAAEIDGCSIPKYFFYVVLPLSKSIIAIMVLFYAVGHWNSFFNALIYVNDSKLYPLQLILRDILINGQSVNPDITDPDMIDRMNTISRTIKYGVIILSSLPVLVIYPFVQKHFVKGVMIGSVKG